jgi:phosphate uptake regulator
MILKAQNGHLTKANAHLNEVVRSQKKIILETENVLSDIQSICKNALSVGDDKDPLKKLENKLSDLA